MAGESIKVEGLTDFRRELKALDASLPKEIQKANKRAAEIVADKARASFAARGGVAPKVAPSVKALASQRYAAVRIGGPQYPYAMGAEWGSNRFRQFDPSRGKQGYSLYPTIRKERDAIVDRMGDALEDIARRAFPN